ncbi:serine--tRNA ligase, partial [Patescibacteria group bacterium]
MLDIQYIRDNWRELQKRIKTKGVELDLGALIKIDDERRKILKKTEDLRAMKNKASLEIAKAAAAQKKKLIEDVKAFDRDAEKLEKTLSGLTAGWSSLLEQIPNPPAPDVKVGRDSSANEIIRVVGWHKDGSFGEGGGPRQFDFKPQSAEELGAALGLIDTARAGKVAGSRFGYLVGGAALLEFALIRYALDRLLLKGFIPILPPVLVKPEIMAGMGYLARGGDEETYRITRFDDDLYLVGTSEQSVVS